MIIFTVSVMFCCGRHQTGTVRTNCLDCLDRTNAVQTMIGLEVNRACYQLDLFSEYCLYSSEY